MPTKIDLEKMSLADLKALRKEVDKAINNFQDRQRAAAMKDMEAIAKKHGLTVSELIGKKGNRRKVKAPAKYANPANRTETWSGRGRQPAWYKKAIAAGKKPKSLEI